MSWLLTAGGAVLDLARSARQIGAGQAAEPRRTAPSKCKRLPFRVPCGIPSIPPALAATGQFQYLGLSARARLPRGDRKYRGDPAADRGSLERMEARSLARRRLGGGAAFEGDVAALPERLEGCQIAVVPRHGSAWTTIVDQVLERGPRRVVVRDSGRSPKGASDA